MKSSFPGHGAATADVMGFGCESKCHQRLENWRCLTGVSVPIPGEEEAETWVALGLLLGKAACSDNKPPKLSPLWSPGEDVG